MISFFTKMDLTYRKLLTAVISLVDTKEEDTDGANKNVLDLSNKTKLYVQNLNAM